MSAASAARSKKNAADPHATCGMIGGPFADGAIECKWKGAYRYKLEAPGHNWFYYQDPPTGGRRGWTWELVAGEKRPPQPPLGELVRQIDRLLPGFPRQYRGPEFFRFTKWLAGSHTGDVRVHPALSVVLNAILLNATLKPFRILTTVCDAHAIVHIQGLKVGEPSWFYLGDETSPYQMEDFMLLAPNAFFEQDDKGNLKKPTGGENFKKTADAFRFVRSLRKYTVTDFSVSEEFLTLGLDYTVEVAPYEKGRYCGCIPIPGACDARDEPERVQTPEVVVQSPVVSRALSELTRIWQDRNTKKSVLISAPPGSGKENFCASLVYGNGRPAAGFQTISMASDDQADLERQLLGFRDGDQVRSGLIEKAANSGIFLDEVHQPEIEAVASDASHSQKFKSAARAALLRPLEARVYLPKGSTEEKKVENVLFIMATSRKLTELGRYDPPDFWTRMTHSVRIDHPLHVRLSSTGSRSKPEAARIDTAKVIDILANFFNFFWWSLVEEFFRSRTVELKNISHTQRLLKWQKESLHYVVRYGFEPTHAAGRHSKTASPAVVFAQRVMQALKNEKLEAHDFSIRGVRNVVLRLFYIAVTNVSEGHSVLPDEKAFGNLVEEIAREIIPMANIR